MANVGSGARSQEGGVEDELRLTESGGGAPSIMTARTRCVPVQHSSADDVAVL